jgi:hypothetical protein
METPRDDQLADELRELRPTPRPEFAAELDQRAAAGFPRRSRLPRFSFPFPARRLLIPAGGLAVLAIAVTSAVVGMNESGQESHHPLSDAAVSSPEPRRLAKPPTYFEGSTEVAPGSVEKGAAEVEGSSASSAAAPLNFDGGAGQNSTFNPTHRAVERSAELILAAAPADVADDSSQVFEAVHAHDGIVMRSSTREGKPGDAAARFELLIPSAKLGDALAALSAIDEVRSRHEATDDITAPTVATGELLQDSKARIDSLLAQLDSAEAESEREAVEAELAQERRHRSRLRGQLQHLERRADYSRVLVRIETRASEESSGGGAWGVGDALGDAGHILAVAAAVTVVALAILGPIALIALLAWLAHRAWVRRERRRVLS